MDLHNTLFVFTTSPAGLGHIRVMDAIKDAGPSGITKVDVGVLNIKANRVHDLGSRNKFFVKVTEFYQTNPVAEAVVTRGYTLWLKRHTGEIIKYFSDIHEKNPDFKKWVIISTHFALAHSISAAKTQIEQKFGIKIYLCVIVTDDSPQKVWAVHGSDIIFVPSVETKAKLSEFFPKERQSSIIANSFPLSPRISQNLSTSEFKFVLDQLNPVSKVFTQMLIPVSGAAVQLDYFNRLIDNLNMKQYFFTVIGQKSVLTDGFFEGLKNKAHVQISIGNNPWQAVSLYESVFNQPSRPAIEITKPSEQAFKAILNPRQRGGVILLLTEPIGRQEYDNLNFLVRNGLMPTDEEYKLILKSTNLNEWIEKAKNWRAIKIPNDPKIAANFIERLKTSGIFYAMLNAVIPDKIELRDNGAQVIWREIDKMLQ